MFIGLGARAQEEGFSENKGLEWYEQHYAYGKCLPLYDLLGVCALKVALDFK
jgi:hypothetical protein